MKVRNLLLAILLTICTASFGQEDENAKYIEVTGTSEIEIVPDEIHFIIEIKEYWAEEFYEKSKPEDYRTKVALSDIEQNLRSALCKAGISNNSIRTQEVGDYWRERGHDFLIAKRFDITLKNFNQIDKIIKVIDTKGIQSMRIGELKNKQIQYYRRQGKIEALKAARTKATYLVEALGKQLGDLIRIVEPQENTYPFPLSQAQSNVRSSQVESFDGFRTIKLYYTMLVRFKIDDRD